MSSQFRCSFLLIYLLSISHSSLSLPLTQSSNDLLNSYDPSFPHLHELGKPLLSSSARRSLIERSSKSSRHSPGSSKTDNQAGSNPYSMGGYEEQGGDGYESGTENPYTGTSQPYSEGSESQLSSDDYQSSLSPNYGYSSDTQPGSQQQYSQSSSPDYSSFSRQGGDEGDQGYSENYNSNNAYQDEYSSSDNENISGTVNDYSSSNKKETNQGGSGDGSGDGSNTDVQDNEDGNQEDQVGSGADTEADQGVENGNGRDNIVNGDGEDNSTNSSIEDVNNNSNSNSNDNQDQGTSNIEQSTSSSVFTSSSSQCSSLSHLYTDMSGSTWVDSTGWSNFSNGGSCCNAYGVTCDSDGKIIALDLGGNGLQGAISGGIFEITTLKRLNMSDNLLSGYLPDQFDSFDNLSAVYLNDNSFSGPLPVSLFNLSTLNFIDVSNNTFFGWLGFPNALSLQNLNAGRNLFSGSLDFTPNPNLVQVRVDENGFGMDLPQLSQLTKLQVFTGKGNGFTGQVGNLSALIQLEQLDLTENNLSGPFPDPSSLSSLKTFLISSNSFVGSFPEGNAPSSLSSCVVDPIPVSECPSPDVLKNEESLANRCRLQCRGGGEETEASSAAGMVGAERRKIAKRWTKFGSVDKSGMMGWKAWVAENGVVGWD